MTIVNKESGNRYEIVKKGNFEVTSCRMNVTYYSRDLASAILHIIKSERANMLLNLSEKSLEQIKSKLAGYNIEERFGNDINGLKKALLTESINLSYYDNILLNINRAVNRGMNYFELGQETGFAVYDEIVQVIKKHVTSRHLMHLS
jgi:hypothetical protein